MNRYEITINVYEKDEEGDVVRTCYKLILQGWSPVEVMTVGATQIQNALSRWNDLVRDGSLTEGAMGVKLHNVNYVMD